MIDRLIDCPTCGRRVRPIRVVYGLPTPELMADATAGRVHLGGCDPMFERERVADCPACGAPIAAVYLTAEYVRGSAR